MYRYPRKFSWTAEKEHRLLPIGRLWTVIGPGVYQWLIQTLISVPCKGRGNTLWPILSYWCLSLHHGPLFYCKYEGGGDKSSSPALRSVTDSCMICCECKLKETLIWIWQALAEGLKCSSALFRHEIGELIITVVCLQYIIVANIKSHMIGFHKWVSPVSHSGNIGSSC